MLGYKTSLNKFKIKIISSIFSNYNDMKLEINYKKKNEKHSNTWRLSNILLNNEWVKNEIKKEIKRYLETNENKPQQLIIQGIPQKQSQERNS